MKTVIQSKDLFNYALMNPVLSDHGIDTLRIVSGYASHALASWHLSLLKAKKQKVNIDLVIGMAGCEGIRQLDHAGFISLYKKDEFDYDGKFECRYVERPLSVHSKVYIWCRGNTPVSAFIGSANYTNNGFLVSNRIETLAECDPISANQFFVDLKHSAVPCQKARKMLFVKGHDKSYAKPVSSIVEIESDQQSPFYGCARIDIPLRNTRKHFGAGSGLNWGLNAAGKPRLRNKKKPNGGRRDPNEAYIRVPKKYDVGFFPKYIKVPRGKKAREAQIPFSVQTDDGKVFSCIRASGGYGKEIETPQDNTELGVWFRERLGIPSGAKVTDKVVRKYGRDKVRFYKLSDDQYFLDFSKPKQK